MKKIFTIVAALFMTASAWAQAPEEMSYQAVVRNSSNNLVTNQAVGMQISILQGGASGTAVYVETQTPTTNINGLVSLEIGTGAFVSGDFSAIDWSNDTYFIKTETDPTGGTAYTITGTSQLLSVPYALHSKTADSISGGMVETDPVFGASVANGITAIDTASWNNHTIDTHIDSAGIATLGYVSGLHSDSTAIANMGFVSGGGSADKFYLGQDTLGGIVFYIYKDSIGEQHGLIVNKTESTAVWQATTATTGANRSEDGTYNTAQMVSSASSAAATYVTSLGTGWYLPSIDELNLLYYNRFTTNKALRRGNFTLLSTTATYWSSTEDDDITAFSLYFRNGYADHYGYNKMSDFSVRAIRAF